MIGKILKARYELVGLLHEGPIFSTFAARDRIQGRDLSIRIIKPPFSHEPSFIDRLANTVQKYSVVQSANIERLTSVESEDGTSFVLGDLTRGPSLADRIRKLAPFSIPVSVGTAISILHALDAVHRSGLVHGDLNPQNMAVMADGDVRLELTGIWEAYSASPTAGVIVLPGMAPYLAPEVSAGAMPSTSSDVYSVGILLYELISGRSPYIAETSLAMAMQHSTAATPSLRTMSLAVPVVLDEIVKKAMSKDPAQRYVSASDMIADLRLLQDALRFGRQLSWPLRPEALPPAQASSGRGPGGRPQPVAPRMSAIRGTAEPKAKGKQKKERDVPIWLMLLFTMGLTLFVSVLGMWFYQNLRRTVWVTVPNIKNRTIAEAKLVLKDSKLSLRISRRESNDKIEQDSILEVDPEPGQKVREGGQVSVVVSSGTKNVKVPELHGLTVDKAKELLGTLNLTLSETITKVPDPKLPVGAVVRSEPSARAVVQRQSLIHIFISSGPGGDSASTAANDSDGFLYTLHLSLKDLSKRTKVRILMLDDDGSRNIYEKMHDSGDTFDITAKGKQPKSMFNIYYDGVLVKSVEKDSHEDPASNEPIQPDANDTGNPNP